jgi:hypothetical protein
MDKYKFLYFSSLTLIKELDEIIKKSRKMEGNCLYKHHSEFDYFNKGNLRYYIFTLHKNINSILEVGFNEDIRLYYVLIQILIYLSNLLISVNTIIAKNVLITKKNIITILN